MGQEQEGGRWPEREKAPAASELDSKARYGAECDLRAGVRDSQEVERVR